MSFTEFQRGCEHHRKEFNSACFCGYFKGKPQVCNMQNCPVYDEIEEG